jgi:hypothetical protein
MPFPQGGDFVRDVSRDFNVVSADPILGTRDEKVQLVGPILSGAFLAGVDSATSFAHSVYQLLASITSTYTAFKLEPSSQGTALLYRASSSNSFPGVLFYGVPSVATSFWRMAQFNPGDLPHFEGISSDLYDYDVFSKYTSMGAQTLQHLDATTPRVHATDPFTSIKNLVSTNYYTTISGEVDPCVGDSVPPYITLHSPTISGAHLRPRDQIIDFSLTDAIGGVDLSTVTVDVTSVSTSGTLNIVQNGIDQTGGYVGVVGTPTSYRFTYDPPFLWNYNEQVLVTISGSDLPPTVDGNPFFCGDNVVNTFSGDIPFQVLNFDDLSAEITVVGDTAPPYVNQTSPASGTVGNSVFSTVSFHLLDDLAGVNLADVSVSVAGIPIIVDGVPTTDETEITGDLFDYTVTYSPDSSFGYGETVSVEVTADDRAKPTANTLNTSYSFSCIDDSSLVISNFKPEVGTHKDLDVLDVVVDITDATHGVDSSQIFFVINGTIVSGTQTSITDGYRLTYHPPNDFAFNEPMRVTVHGVNSDVVAPVVKEAFYTLFYGCRIFMFNDEPYAHAENIDVFVRARNNEQLYKDLTTGYFFTTYTQPQSNLGASIEAINPQVDLPATLTVIGPEHRYGETVTVEFSIEDLDGRLLGPYSFTYTIEDKP